MIDVQDWLKRRMLVKVELGCDSLASMPKRVPTTVRFECEPPDPDSAANPANVSRAPETAMSLRLELWAPRRPHHRRRVPEPDDYIDRLDGYRHEDVGLQPASVVD